MNHISHVIDYRSIKLDATKRDTFAVQILLRALEQPRNEGPVEPVALLALERPLRLVRKECLLFAVNLVFACVEIGLVRLHSLCLLDDLVAEDEN
jgi:hypothetical protein